VISLAVMSLVQTMKPKGLRLCRMAKRRKVEVQMQNMLLMLGNKKNAFQ